MSDSGAADGPGNEEYRELVRQGVERVPVARLVGFRAVELGAGTATFEMDAGERHHNPMGTVHGGGLCDIADGAMGMAFGSTLVEGDVFTTLELKINFLKPVRQSRLRARARVVSRGKAVGMVECDITDDSGQLVARASSTVYVMKKA